MTSLNERQKRTMALQASGTYLMSHIADVMEMIQDQHALNDELDEETLVSLEAQVKALAEELTHQSPRYLVGVSLTKRGRTFSMQER